MKIITLLLFIFPNLMSLAQNLVPNPGFDSIIECPVDGQIKFAPPWSFITNLQIASSQGSANLFNACVPPPGHGVPLSRYGGYQPARSGDGYAQVHTYGDGRNYVRSYIQAPLLLPLQSNKSYYIRFYVSPGSLYGDKPYFFTDAVGLGFHKNSIDSFLPMFSPPPSVSVAVENRGIILKDTMNWIKISGCYQAKGEEDYVILGSFITDQETIFEDQLPHADPNYAWYWIDDVLVSLFDPLPDTLIICEGELKTLNAGFLDASYYWNTGETDSTIIIQNAGEYIVEVILDNCVLHDTVEVIELSDINNFSIDTMICQDEILILTFPVPGDYLWFDGSTNKSFMVRSKGIYEVTITNACGEYFFSANVATEDCDCNIYVPNALSPNGDGISDELLISIGCDFQNKVTEFSVFDRWGTLIYNAQEGDSIKWDGNYKSISVQNGVYTWILKYEIVRNGRTEYLIKSGDVTVMR